MTSEPDPKARQLIGMALQGERRLPRNRERVRRGVLAAAAAPLALSASEGAFAATKAAGTKAALVGVTAWVKLAPVLILATVAGAVGYQQLALPTRVAERSKVAPALSPPAPVPSQKLREIVAPEAEPSAALAAPVAAAHPKSSKSPVRGVAEESPAALPGAVEGPPSLASELEALQRAQRALNGGNAASALAELGAVKGRALSAERTALEVFALCKLGNVGAARQKAALFRQLAPESPLLPRVKASCAGE